MRKKVIIITVILFFIDFFTKIIIDNILNLNETVGIILNFFSITKVYNYGASWNILAGHQILIIITTLIILAFLFNYERKFKINNRNTWAFSLLYSGILGNLINRIFYGYVIDFLDFQIFGWDYPIFNFADICIVLGIIFLIIAIFKKEDEVEISS